MEARLDFKGTGGELFAKLIVGALLMVVTLGIYAPWFQVSLNKYIYSVTRIRGTQRGDLQLEFTGTGGQLFVIGLVGGLLTAITIGIYFPWFLVKLIRWYEENTTAKAADGTTYKLQSDLNGGELFVTFLVGYLLTVVTIGIYAPWFMCKLQKLFAEKTQILEQGRPSGRLNFVGQGGELFVTFLVGYLLTMVTLGIYASWFQVKMLKFFATNTEVAIAGRTYRGDFVGTGGELFVLNLVGVLLTMITLGIYGFWYLAKSLAFQLNNTMYRPAGRERAQVPASATPVHA
jgi:uncharacterized membrane protein YjgN (DUF898 family)